MKEQQPAGAGSNWQVLRGGKPPLARFDAARRAARRAQLKLLTGGRDESSDTSEKTQD